MEPTEADWAARAEAAEIEAGLERGPWCISGCSCGTDGGFHHHPYCGRFGVGEGKRTTFAGRTWVAESSHNSEILGAMAALTELRRFADKRQDEYTGTTNQRAWSHWQRVIDFVAQAQTALRSVPAASPSIPERK